jgi:DNA polymerase I-like protein with 3'-5' exonuclease and polymerase domains
MSQPETSGLSDVQLHLVDSVEKASEFLRWLGERRPHNAVGLDTETGERLGGPRSDALSPWHGDLRLVQIGDSMQGWAIPWEDWSGVFYEAMNKFEGPIVCHNIAFEARWFDVKSKWSIPWHRAHDTMIMAHLIDPLGSGALKRLAALYVDPKSANLQATLDTELSKNGWTWGSVPINFTPYWCVPLDTEILTRSGWKRYSEIGAEDQTLGYRDGKLEWTNVRSVKTFDNAPLVTVGNKYWSTECTPQHRWVYESQKYLKGKYDGYGDAQVAPLDQIWSSKRNRLVLSAPAEGGSGSLTPDEAAVVAWLLSDGNIYWQRPTSSPIAHIIQHPKKFSSEIRELLKREGAYVSEKIQKDSGCIRFYLQSSYVTRLWHKANLFEKDYIGLVLSLSKDARKSWWDAWYMAEGTYVNGVRKGVISQNFGPKFDALVLTSYMEGFIPRIKKVNNNHGKIQCGTRKPTPQKSKLKDAGVGDVWCPVTDLGTWTARDRDGRVFVTGNTYGALDPVITMRIWEKFYDSCGPNGEYEKAYELEMAVRKIVTRMEVNGARVDLDYSKKKYEELISYTEQVKDWALKKYDGVSITSNVQLVRLIGRLGGVITEVTPSGQKSASKEQIYRLSIEGNSEVRELATAVLQQRKADKLATTYFLNFMEKHVDGILHPSVRTLGARTGRMSITDPALQTLPAGDSTVRRAFIPKDSDHVIISSDLDQVEFRLTAAMSHDQQLISLFRQADETGGDAFTEIMRDIYQDPSLQKSDPRRKLVKGVVYGKLYGAGVTKMALTAGVPEEQMRPVVDAFDRSYPGVRDLQKQIEDTGTRRLKLEGQGYVRTQTGRRLPCDDNRVYSLTNYLVQSSAAEVFKMNLVKMDMADLTELLIVPVHDEIVLQAPREDVAEIMQTVKQCMTTTEGWEVPLTAGVDGPFENWGQKYE